MIAYLIRPPVIARSRGGSPSVPLIGRPIPSSLIPVFSRLSTTHNASSHLGNNHRRTRTRRSRSRRAVHPHVRLAPRVACEAVRGEDGGQILFKEEAEEEDGAGCSCHFPVFRIHVLCRCCAGRGGGGKAGRCRTRARSRASCQKDEQEEEEQGYQGRRIGQVSFPPLFNSCSYLPSSQGTHARPTRDCAYARHIKRRLPRRRPLGGRTHHDGTGRLVRE